jgi:hypothetical protein
MCFFASARAVYLHSRGAAHLASRSLGTLWPLASGVNQAKIYYIPSPFHTTQSHAIYFWPSRTARGVSGLGALCREVS